MKLRFTPRAVNNITAIAEYFRERNPTASLRVRTSIYNSLQHLLLFPSIGKAQKERGVRKLVTSRYRYLIYYIIDEPAQEIVILSVKHSAQDRENQDS